MKRINEFEYNVEGKEGKGVETSVNNSFKID